ncbi:thioredoxin-disulfide reductase [Candidatus Hydrogenosomobacter endosymbioticus]|uniref:Thioredoxin reductase n=1 Tax=Candidatus Hydrogenosomobacter endosymbioticus TaxID=2558174 RepID=A0ABN6L5V3_9PROT|nr:thioredoxin-disulfide reductase [Candidatus Hydrogenosomobacter endosymbioticus]BDB95881.1 thioredoxin reductase [Candidatus Hydrogenosomobacter endosymbioticus]
MTLHNSIETDLLVIGSGPAGYTAAIYASRSAIEVLLISGNQPGGQLTLTEDIENYPGFKDPIRSRELMKDMREQAARYGTTILDDIIEAVDFSARPFLCKGKSSAYRAKSVIIATGASANWLDIPGEMEFLGYGVSGCAVCDGFFFRGKDVIVVGGGNTAVEDALFLSGHAKSVTLIHRRNSLRAEIALQNRLFDKSNVKMVWDSVVLEIHGSHSPKKVTGAKIKNIKTGAESSIETSGVFIAIGRTPNSGIFNNHIEVTNSGYIATKSCTCSTNIDGVFAAGDVMNEQFRQAVVAAGYGCIAALQVKEFLGKVYDL